MWGFENRGPYRIPGYEEWFMRDGKMSYSVNVCPYCGERLEPPEPPNVAVIATMIRKWLHERKDPVTCRNLVYFMNILEQVEAGGYRSLSPENQKIYLQLANMAQLAEEKPKPPEVKIEVSREVLLNWEHGLGEAILDAAGHACLATVCGIHGMQREIRKMLRGLCKTCGGKGWIIDPGGGWNPCPSCLEKRLCAVCGGPLAFNADCCGPCNVYFDRPEG